MKTKLPLVLVGVSILFVGLVLGWWIAGKVPPPVLPPVPWTGPGPRPDKEEKDRDGHPRPAPTADQVAKFRAEMDQIEPQLEAFQQGYITLTKDFDARFIALLTDDQKKLHEKLHNSGAGGAMGGGGVDWIAEFRSVAEGRVNPPGQPGQGSGQGQAAPTPFGGGSPGGNGRDRRRQQERLFRSLLHVVMYEPFLRLTVDAYHLTPEQTAATEKLMETRRVAFLKLADAHPLPFDRLFLSLRDLGFLPPVPSLTPAGTPPPPPPQ